MDLQNTTMKNISEKQIFVIILALFYIFAVSCRTAHRENAELHTADSDNALFDPPEITGFLQSRELNESSGLAASKCQPNVFWAHNDSGGGPFLFAIDQFGRNLGVWRVANAANEDWEDIAAYKDTDGNCFLFIGEIGDNRQIHKTSAIYRIPEPTITRAEPASPADAPSTKSAEVIRFRYPAASHNAETLLVHPVTGSIYVITKRLDGPAEVFKIEPQFSSQDVLQAEKIGEIALPAVPNGLVTGGDMSPDGTKLVLCDYLAGYIFISDDGDFDSIWQQTPIRFDLGERKIGEAVAFDQSGTSVVATSEGIGSPLIFVRMIR